MSDIQFQGYSEEQIREGCFRGDRRFQQMLYDMFSSKMFGVCMRYANEYNAAQDLLQEGFVKVFRNIDKFRGEGSFEGWVRRIFVNTAIEHSKSQLARARYLLQKMITEQYGNVGKSSIG
ncbi:MAG: sigma-70 family RNA polymerase sigma factor [Bacteroidetes bacterium]|nr:sigma-70 family RNA polymerase sigma factor [Bacteroidota bacterium]